MKRVKSYNGLRMIFCLMVFLTHLNYLTEANPMVGGIYNQFLRNGSYAVTFFILLSGFLVGGGYSKKFESIDKTSYISFVLRRIRTVFIPYCLTMIYAFVYVLITEKCMDGLFVIKNVFKLGLSFSMLQTLTVKYGSIFNAAGWYISCLFVLWLATPFFLKWIGPSSKQKKIITCIASYLIIVTITLLSDFVLKAPNGSIIFEIIYRTPYFRVFYYLIGLIVGDLIVNEINPNSIDCRVVNIIEIVTLLAIFIVFELGIRYCFWKQSANIAYVPFLIFVIIVFYYDKGVVSIFLGNKFFAYFGSRSLYIYLIHYVVINCGGSRLVQKISGNSVFGCVIGIIVLFLITLLISEIVYRINSYVCRGGNIGNTQITK